MQEQNDLNSTDLELEQALRSIQPTPAHLNPTTAAFLAGQLSTRRRLRLWQSSTAILLLGIGSSRIFPSSPATRAIPLTQSVYSYPPTPPLPNHSLLMLEQAVQKNGLAGLSPTNLPDPSTLRPENAL